MLLLSLGVLLCSSALAQTHPPAADLQSMKINQTVDPIFPRDLMNSGVTTGACQIAISVDAAGQLAEVLVVRYTQPEFGAAAVTAVKRWTFEPARMNGEAVASTLDLVFNFEARGVVVSTTTVGEAAQAMTLRILGDAYSYGPCPLERLDRVPIPTVTVMPQYSKELAAKGVKGPVTVEYYIDETGAVRLACVSPEANQILGALTVAAVSQWKFAPPTSHGRPVLVRASQVFDFKGDDS